jgi:phage FluMu protein Com
LNIRHAKCNRKVEKVAVQKLQEKCEKTKIFAKMFIRGAKIGVGENSICHELSNVDGFAPFLTNTDGCSAAG